MSFQLKGLKTSQEKDLFNLFLNGDIPTKKVNHYVNCSDSDINCWDENQAEYYYDLPINYIKHNKLDIRLNINVSLFIIDNVSL